MSLDLEDSAAVFNAAREGKRDRMDRYRDFRALFRGTEAGQRVLDDLLHMCGVHQRTAVKGDATETYFREGQRSIGISILMTIRDEPKQRPTRQQSRESE